MLDERRYNGLDQISRETSGLSDQESRGAIGVFLLSISSDQIVAVHHDPTVTT